MQDDNAFRDQKVAGSNPVTSTRRAAAWKASGPLFLCLRGLKTLILWAFPGLRGPFGRKNRTAAFQGPISFFSLFSFFSHPRCGNSVVNPGFAWWSRSRYKNRTVA
jgi:hypothetical protein